MQPAAVDKLNVTALGDWHDKLAAGAASFHVTEGGERTCTAASSRSNDFSTWVGIVSNVANSTGHDVGGSTQCSTNQ